MAATPNLAPPAAGAPPLAPTYPSALPPEYSVSTSTLIAAEILAVIGGVFILFAGFLEFFAGTSLIGLAPEYLPGVAVLIVFGTLGLASGTLVVILGVMLPRHPKHHVAFGAIILVCGLASFVSYFGGFFFGLLCSVIAGVLALTWTPRPVLPYYVGPPVLRVCPRCGRVLTLTARFCPHCGNVVS
jgi:hypothetical protein